MDRDAIREMLLYLNAKINEKEHQLKRAQGLASFWLFMWLASVAGILAAVMANLFTGEP
jgi:hypothetical protein